METRKIYYIDGKEDTIDQEVQRALKRTMEENMGIFLQTLKTNMAMMSIDYLNPKVKKVIYYIEDESN